MASDADKSYMPRTFIRLVAVLVSWVVVGCTEPTPNLCCTDAADCEAVGLPSGQACDDGRACRGHMCVSEVCHEVGDCNAAAPYCILDDNLCAATCTGDAQCPGLAQAADQQFCVAGACVECRTGMNDCPLAAPQCVEGSCRACAQHDQCASRICSADGVCAAEFEIAHAAPDGANGGDCGKLSPCTLGRALDLARPYVLLGPGTYQNVATLLVRGKQSLVGDGTARPVVTNKTTGPVFSVETSSDVTFDHLQISGATGPQDGTGVSCNASQGGLRSVHFIDAELSQNEYAGVYGLMCSIFASRSVFRGNGSGVDSTDSTGTYDRCVVHGNGYRGLNLDGGLFTVTNSFFYGNGGAIAVYPSRPGTTIAFNTIVDNDGAIGCVEDGTSSGAFANNIIARNKFNPGNTSSCTYPGSIVTDDIAPLKFVRPNASPPDYHLMPGSIAIDQAMPSTIDHDFDGEARQKGRGRDVGADEAE